MDILSIATQWAKAEIFSSKFFILVGLLFVITSIGFWQIGKSELAKAYVIPTLVCGILVIIIGVGLTYNNYSRISLFAEQYNNNKVEFVNSEIERTNKTIIQTERTIYKSIPIIIIVAAIFIMFFDKPILRATSITVIAMMITLLVVDSNSHSRIVTYNKTLLEIDTNKPDFKNF